MESGIIAIDKPEGISSAQVVARVKKVLKAKKVGHTGTLDPFATGLLLCSVNKGTRISQFLLSGSKQYRATVHLGVETDTYDRTGQVVSDAGTHMVSQLTPVDVNAVIVSFEGPQHQTPPAFSALKHKGQPLYKLARKGIKVDKPPRPIEIFGIAIEKISLPFVEIKVDCSAGTYIRSLAFDIGRKLGCGAHLSALTRTRSSHFELENAITLDELENMVMADAQKKIIPLSDAVSFLPKVILEQPDIQKVGFGQRLSVDKVGSFDEKKGQAVRLVDEKNNLLAIVRFDKPTQTYNYSCVLLS